ncbi:hypothetical protein SAMN02910456_02445 [Ruminococcaceae bacterium YRB3002]|nr:hypothetical protein SAMN02910456_02445 [Ruminococcaceae bacterium YRB3002]
MSDDMEKKIQNETTDREQKELSIEEQEAVSGGFEFGQVPVVSQYASDSPIPISQPYPQPMPVSPPPGPVSPFPGGSGSGGGGSGPVQVP